MVAKKIAVSGALSPVKRLLNHEGYDVFNIENEEELSGVGMDDYDAIILTGIDRNLMGVHRLFGGAPIIEAAGKSPEEILDELHVRLGPVPD